MSWITSHLQTGGMYYVNLGVAPANLSNAQKAARKTLESQIAVLRGNAAEEGKIKLAQEPGINAMHINQQNVRRAYHINNAYHNQATVLIPTNMQSLTQKIEVDASKFHAEIIKLATAGLDFPSKDIEKNSEKLIALIKESLKQNGEQSLNTPVFIQGVLFALDPFGDWRCIVRTITVQVDQQLLKAAGGGKDAQQTVKMTMNIGYNDWEFEPTNLKPAGPPFNGGSTSIGGVQLPAGTLPNHPLVINITQNATVS